MAREIMTTARTRDVTQFYDLLAEVQRRTGGVRTLEEVTAQDVPARGVYFFFEPGEMRSDGRLRLVRIGTHAVSEGSQATLWKRLVKHRGGLRSGWGDHRGSIFRKLVGEALLAREADSTLSECWLRDKDVPPAERETERELEMAVSRQIRRMPVMWIEVDDEPSARSRRAWLERNAIGLLTAAPEASPGWLGRWSSWPAVRTSGLWNNKYVGQLPDAGFVDELERMVG